MIDGAIKKPERIGLPYHGLVRNDVLTLPNSATLPCQLRTQGALLSNQTAQGLVFRRPAAPGDPRSAAEKLEQKQVYGKEFRNYLLAQSKTTSTYVNGENLFSFGGFPVGWSWLQADAEEVSIYSLRLLSGTASSTLQLLRHSQPFGVFSASIPVTPAWVQIDSRAVPHLWKPSTELYFGTVSASESGEKAIVCVYERSKFGGHLYDTLGAQLYDENHPFFIISKTDGGVGTLRMIYEVDIAGVGASKSVTITTSEPTVMKSSSVGVDRTVNYPKSGTVGADGLLCVSGTIPVVIGQETTHVTEETLAKWVEGDGAVRFAKANSTRMRNYGGLGAINVFQATGCECCVTSCGTYAPASVTAAERIIDDDWSWTVSIEDATGTPVYAHTVLSSDTFQQAIGADVVIDCDYPDSVLMPGNVIDGTFYSDWDLRQQAVLDKQPYIRNAVAGVTVYDPSVGEITSHVSGLNATTPHAMGGYPDILSAISNLKIATNPAENLITQELTTDGIFYV